MRETCEMAVTEFINGINYLLYDTVEYRIVHGIKTRLSFFGGPHTTENIRQILWNYERSECSRK